MKKILFATAFAVAMSAAGTIGASAQSTGPSGQDSMRAERMMNSNARMGHHRMHRMKMHKRHHMMKRRMHRM
jgi:hypothetical protein